MPIQYARNENRTLAAGKYTARVLSAGTAGLESVVDHMIARGSTVGRAGSEAFWNGSAGARIVSLTRTPVLLVPV